MADTTAPAALDFPALDGRPVTEAHARTCRERGHAAHTVDGVDSGVCPRCGEVTAPAPASARIPDDSRYVLHTDGRVVALLGYHDAEQALVYDPVAARECLVAADDLLDPLAGQTVDLTPAQRDIAQMRFNDLADEYTDGGAKVIGSTLQVTHVAEALGTIDDGIDICDDNVQSGYLAAKYAAERRTLRNLRAKVLAAALADPRNARG